MVIRFIIQFEDSQRSNRFRRSAAVDGGNAACLRRDAALGCEHRIEDKEVQKHLLILERLAFFSFCGEPLDAPS